jgi:hypothetical protein
MLFFWCSNVSWMGYPTLPPNCCDRRFLKRSLRASRYNYRLLLETSLRSNDQKKGTWTRERAREMGSSMHELSIPFNERNEECVVAYGDICIIIIRGAFKFYSTLVCSPEIMSLLRHWQPTPTKCTHARFNWECAISWRELDPMSNGPGRTTGLEQQQQEHAFDID